MGFIVASLIALLEKLLQRNGGEKAYYSTTDPGEAPAEKWRWEGILFNNRHVFTQEEGGPLCSSENEEEYLTSDDESVQTDYVLAEIGSSSEDDDEEGDDTQITVTTTRSGRRATLYLL